MADKQLLARAVVHARASLEEALKDIGRWPLAELHQLFEAVAAYTDATAGDEMIHRCVAGCVSGLHEYLADQGKHVPPDTVHEARCLEVLLFESFDLPSDDHDDLEQGVDVQSEHETDEHSDGGESGDDENDEDQENEQAEQGAEAEEDEEGEEDEEDEQGEDDEREEGEEDEEDDTTEGDDSQARRDDEETP